MSGLDPHRSINVKHPREAGIGWKCAQGRHRECSKENCTCRNCDTHKNYPTTPLTKKTK